MMKKIALLLLGLNAVAAMVVLAMEMLAPPDEPPPIGKDVPGLVLLSERTGENGSAPAQPQHDMQAVQDAGEAAGPEQATHEDGSDRKAAATEPEICLSVGPFADEAAVEKAIALLKEHGMTAKPRTEWHDEFFGYWVYLPPYPSREAAVAVTRELKLHGIEDFFIVLASARQNAISLGVYRNHDTAVKLQQRLKSMDFDARIEKRMRSRPEYWLDYQGHLRPGGEMLSRLKQVSAQAGVKYHDCGPESE